MNASAEEEEELINYPFVTVVGVSSGLTAFASVAQMAFSLIHSPNLGARRHLLVYLLALGLCGIMQAMYLAYLVLGETVGFLATNAVTGCFIISAIEKYLESLPFMLLAALVAELSGSFDCCMKRKRGRRALLIVLQILLTILVVNIAVFVNTHLRQHRSKSTGEVILFCVNTIPTMQMLLYLRAAALGIGYIGPFLALLFFHLARLCSHSFPIRGLWCFTLPIFVLRWAAWLPVHVHAVIFDTGLIISVLNADTIIRLHYVGAMLIGVAGVLETLLVIGLVWLIVRHETVLTRSLYCQRMIQETPV